MLRVLSIESIIFLFLRQKKNKTSIVCSTCLTCTTFLYVSVHVIYWLAFYNNNLTLITSKKIFAINKL